MKPPFYSDNRHFSLLGRGGSLRSQSSLFYLTLHFTIRRPISTSEMRSLVRRDPEFAASADSGDAVFRQSRECRPLVPARRLFCLITVFDFLAAVIIWLLYANVSTIFRFVQLALCTFPAHHTRNSSRICRIFADRLNPRYETQRSGLLPVFPESKFPSQNIRDRFRGRFPRSGEVIGPTAESGPASEVFEVKQ